MHRSYSDMQCIHLRFLGQWDLRQKCDSQRVNVGRRFELRNVCKYLHAFLSSDDIARPTFGNDKLRHEQVILNPPIIPPVIGNLLIGSGEKVATWTRSQVSNHAGFQVHAAFHKFATAEQ